jgi:hypothetical protein
VTVQLRTAAPRRRESSTRYPDTTPAAKYGPTPVYGVCEAVSCAATARRTCPACEGQYCLGHVGHDLHGPTAD